MLVCGCAHRCQHVLCVVETSRAASCGSAASVMAAPLRRMAIDVLRFHREAKDSAEAGCSSRQARDWVARVPSTSCVGGSCLWYRARVSFLGDGEVCVKYGIGIQWLLWNGRGECPPKVRSHKRVAPSLLLRNYNFAMFQVRVHALPTDTARHVSLIIEILQPSGCVDDGARGRCLLQNLGGTAA